MKDIGTTQKGKLGNAELFVPRTDTSFDAGLRTPCSINVKVIPVTAYSASCIKIPLYTSHTTLKHNILAENVKKLAVWPHFAVEEDNAEQDLYPELKERYSHGNPDNRRKTLHMREKNKQLGPYVKSFLNDLGCTVDDVLRSFLEGSSKDLSQTERDDIFNTTGIENDPKMPSLRRKWALALSILPKTSEQRQRNVVLACEAFNSIAGLTLWPFIKHFYDRSKVAPITAGLQEHSISTYNKLACRVCHVQVDPFRQKKHVLTT